MAEAEWLRLQKKIFSRWINQKISKVIGKPVDDCVKTMQDGVSLLVLMEVLSEKKFTGKINRNPKMRPHYIENAGMAIKFAKDCGVSMKLWPSPEDIIDGNERQVLGLLWNIMLKFMKFGDEEGSDHNAKDALMMWCQNTIKGYGIKLENWKSSWHDGLALCAIIHKFRPNLIDWASLDSNNKKENIQIAMDAANKYFDLEQYLTPDDFLKLDENSMVVYVSEYYYGIAEQRKLDLAAKRIGKVIKLTKENDATRAAYNETAKAFTSRVKEVEKILEDRTKDNTMAGAKARLEQFYEYKTKDKNLLLSQQLDLEAIYNNLSTVLAQNKRPPFQPPPGCSLADISATMVHLEKCEQERKFALHKELNRQIKLFKLNEHHDKRAKKLESWIAQKRETLSLPPMVDSVSTAQLQNLLVGTFEKELASIKSSAITPLLNLGRELKEEDFEGIEAVQQRETSIHKGIEELQKISQLLQPVLADLLAIYEYQVWVRDTVASLEDLLFGFTLEEVTAFGTTLDSLLENHSAEAKAKAALFADVQAHMDALPTLDAQYKQSVKDLIDSINEEFEMGISASKMVYDAELELQKDNDAKCKAFADVAEPLVKWIQQEKEAISCSSASIEDQVALVEARLGSLDQDGASMSEIAAAFKKIEEAGITDIRHTSLTLRDVEVLWEQWESFLEKKLNMLKQEIERSKLRGVTPEQLAEIESNFAQFDKDGDGLIDPRTLKACMYSLGEERTGKEIDELLAKHGSSSGVTLEGFKNLMIEILGVSDSKDDILNSFRMICKSDNAETIGHEPMAKVMPQQDVEYIESTAPKKSAEWDFVAWTEDVFSR